MKNIKVHFVVTNFEYLEMDFDSLEEFEKEYSKIRIHILEARSVALKEKTKFEDGKPPFEG